MEQVQSISSLGKTKDRAIRAGNQGSIISVRVHANPSVSSTIMEGKNVAKRGGVMPGRERHIGQQNHTGNVERRGHH